MADEPVSVLLLSQLDQEQGKFAEATQDIHLIDRGLLPAGEDIDPLVKLKVLTIPAPEMGDGLSDIDRLQKTLSAGLQVQGADIPLGVLKSLPQVLREDEGRVTIAYFAAPSGIKIVGITASDTLDRNFGVCIDIGTTTIAVQLVDMRGGRIIGSKTDYNAQIECGLDVISRINYAKKPQRLEELREKVTGTINGIIRQLAEANRIAVESVYNVSVAGNTTMVHLVMGIFPEYIRLEPYSPAVYQVPLYRASELGIAANPEAPVYFAPSVGSYVGGDITSGLLCTSLATDSEELCLFIDIGTNGEIVLGNNEFLLGCACSAGPAFEGGGIDSGMRASNGAIEKVEVDRETGRAEYSTIGNGPPVGICGSGLISLIANLFSTGWIDAGGKLDRHRGCESIEFNGKYSTYIVAAADQTASGKPIAITEADIDNLIRAKAAIFSACYTLLQKIQLGFDDLTRIYIAGGFGRYLNIEKSTVIGLIPLLPGEKFKFIGNSSVIGAYMTLVSKRHREKELELARKITYIDLSTEPDYMYQYTAALFLPHTDADLFKPS
ncbi:MAG: ASKHA domain-containing protein [Clostridia bacterium]|nr:ASKHA domain-containing protein [Clostridia bacterium]